MTLLKLANELDERQLSLVEQDFLDRNYPVTTEGNVKGLGVAGATVGGALGGFTGAGAGAGLGVLINKKVMRKAMPIAMGVGGAIAGAKAGNQLGTLVGNVSRQHDEKVLSGARDMLLSNEKEDALAYINMLERREDRDSEMERFEKTQEIERARLLNEIHAKANKDTE